MHLSKEFFLEECRRYRDTGFSFLGMQKNEDTVSYLFQGDGEVKRLEQSIESGGISSIAQLYPLADFAERQMYRECEVKAIGNINLMPDDKKDPD